MKTLWDFCKFKNWWLFFLYWSLVKNKANIQTINKQMRYKIILLEGACFFSSTFSTSFNLYFALILLWNYKYFNSHRLFILTICITRMCCVRQLVMWLWLMLMWDWIWQSWGMVVWGAFLCDLVEVGGREGGGCFCPQVPVGHPRLSLVRRLRRLFLIICRWLSYGWSYYGYY